MHFLQTEIISKDDDPCLRTVAYETTTYNRTGWVKRNFCELRNIKCRRKNVLNLFTFAVGNNNLDKVLTAK